MDLSDLPHKEKYVNLDRMFETLADWQRRQILTAMMASTPRWKDEFETEEARPPGTARDTAAIDLQHCHLPRLDEANFIDWDPTTGLITRGANFHEVQPLLERIAAIPEQLPENRT